MNTSKRVKAMVLIAALFATVGMAPAQGASRRDDTPAAQRGRYWTEARRAAATPRDLVIDERGRGFLRQADGTYRPYGASPSPMDALAPAVSNQDPAEGVTIGASYTFKATVTDPDGVKAVSFTISRSDGSGVQTVSASRTSRRSDVWAAAVQGLTDGAWKWTVTARDGVKRNPNTATSPAVNFSVSTGTSGGGGGGTTEPDIVKNAQWTYGGDVQNAAGRVFFEMPTNTSHTSWAGYVCSGTAAGDNGRAGAIVITAAHCVYDDVYKAFARNVLFIPNQAGGGSTTDRNCGNDPLGCWGPSHGVVDVNWTTRQWPDNIPWDYAYYVVPESGAHTGNGTHDSLEAAVNELPIQFSPPATARKTHALGYSYSDDPNFMYCAEAMGTSGADNWWLANCGLSGGASGGPWVQPMDLATGTGPIISVNSWGYRNQPGMAGPRLDDSSASCVFTNATLTNQNDTTGDGGYKATC